LSIGVIIQARVGSTRFENKVIIPFFRNKNVLEIIIEKFQENSQKYPVIIATTDLPGDNIIADIAKKNGLNVYMGSENNVLNRFIKAAKEFGIDTIVRVCADNPFFDVSTTYQLLESEDYESFDYISYYLEGGLVTIKSHLGLWGEVVKLSALEQVFESTQSPKYLEHVTNYIYSNKNDFKIKLIKAPEKLFQRIDIRLTMDDVTDFNLYQKIYNNLYNLNSLNDIDKIIDVVDSEVLFLKEMKRQINKYNK